VVKLDEHYLNPRLVALYDLENTGRDDTNFYVNLASELGAKHILDLGCGTGVLALALVAEGRRIVGIDPSAAMLDFARKEAGAELVEWLEGDASILGKREADLLLMTGNVAQVFLDDNAWMNTLKASYAALRSGGYIAFESRNPEARGWEKWNRKDSYTKFDSPEGEIETWVEVLSVADGRVKMEGHNVFLATGEHLVAESVLRFRSHEEISKSLREAGFSLEHTYGDWKKGEFQNTSRMMIFIARRG
jgi:SAM-dependent methyltransferase